MRVMDISTFISREPQKLFFHWLSTSVERLVLFKILMKQLKQDFCKKWIKWLEHHLELLLSPMLKCQEANGTTLLLKDKEIQLMKSWLQFWFQAKILISKLLVLLDWRTESAQRQRVLFTTQLDQLKTHVSLLE